MTDLIISDDAPWVNYRIRMQQSVDNAWARFNVQGLLLQIERGGLTPKNVLSAFEQWNPAELEGFHDVKGVLVHLSDPALARVSITTPILPLDPRDVPLRFFVLHSSTSQSVTRNREYFLRELYRVRGSARQGWAVIDAADAETTHSYRTLNVHRVPLAPARMEELVRRSLHVIIARFNPHTLSLQLALDLLTNATANTTAISTSISQGRLSGFYEIREAGLLMHQSSSDAFRLSMFNNVKPFHWGDLLPAFFHFAHAYFHAVSHGVQSGQPVPWPPLSAVDTARVLEADNTLGMAALSLR